MRTSWPRAAVCVVFALLWGCQGELASNVQSGIKGPGEGELPPGGDIDMAVQPPGAGDMERAPEDLSEQGEANFDIYTRLKPACVQCHGSSGSSRFFLSFQVFEDTLVYDTRFVQPGDPQGSYLVAMLEGRGDALGQYAQMPLNRSYAQMEVAGFAEIAYPDGVESVGVDEIRDWIASLSARADRPASIRDEVSLMRRKRAEQVVGTLYAQLGLSDGDFANPTFRYGDTQKYPVRSPDATPTPNRYAGTPGTHGMMRWEALGGPSFLNGSRRAQDTSTTFGRTITNVAQAWCRLSVESKDALFAKVGKDVGSGDDLAAIKDNLTYLHLRMLGHVAPADEVDAFYEEVFRPYEQRSGVRTAWIASCATLVRDPRWLAY